MKKVRNGTAISASAVSAAARAVDAPGLSSPSRAGDAAAFVDVDELLAEMEALLEKCERAPLGVEVSEVVRERLDEVGRRRDEWRDHEEPEEPERGESDDEDDRRRTATADSATLERTDRRIERHREERGDEHPGDRVQRQVHEHQREDRAGGDRHPDEDRLRRERDSDRRLGRAAFRRRLDAVLGQIHSRALATDERRDGDASR